MSLGDAERGHAVIAQPDDGSSSWQPLPARGRADPKAYPELARFARTSSAQSANPVRFANPHRGGFERPPDPTAIDRRMGLGDTEAKGRP